MVEKVVDALKRYIKKNLYDKIFNFKKKNKLINKK
jgi:hypothetical protein